MLVFIILKSNSQKVVTYNTVHLKYTYSLCVLIPEIRIDIEISHVDYLLTRRVHLLSK